MFRKFDKAPDIMKKIQKKKELLDLLVDFFASENHYDGIWIKDKIFKEVSSCPFSPKASILLNNSIAIWQVDVSNYLTTFSDHSNTFRHLAYLGAKAQISKLFFR